MTGYSILEQLYFVLVILDMFRNTPTEEIIEMDITVLELTETA